MAPTKSNEGRHSSNGQGSAGRSWSGNTSNRKAEHWNDRSGVDTKSSDQGDFSNNRQQDKGGSRSRGGRRKPRSNNSRPTTNKSVEARRDRVYSECSDEHCPVCLNRMQIHAVGMCNHPVCSECSTRMRILCAQNECPICRQDMPKVGKM